jgi:hypothetical protein
MALAQGGLHDAHRASPCPISLPARNTLLECRTRRASAGWRRTNPARHAWPCVGRRVRPWDGTRPDFVAIARALIPGRR